MRGSAFGGNGYGIPLLAGSHMAWQMTGSDVLYRLAAPQMDRKDATLLVGKGGCGAGQDRSVAIPFLYLCCSVRGMLSSLYYSVSHSFATTAGPLQ